MKSLSILAVLSLAAALAAGCGSDGGETPAQAGGDEASTTAEPLTKAEFIKQGDAICEKTDKAQEADYRAYTAKHAKSTKTKAGQEYLVTDIGLPPVKTEVEELAALGVPRGDEQEINAIIAGIKLAIGRAEEEPESTEFRVGNPFDEVDKLAAKYGFKVCNQAL